MRQQWAGIAAAVALAGAMLAIALLGLLPHTSKAAPAQRASAAAAKTSLSRSARSGVRASATKTKVTKPLAGKVVGVDPGHNGRNWSDPAYIDRQVWNGREYENCNTTGTETDGGYTEARFNWNVGRYLAADLRKLGARVVLTRHNNHGVGPCVTKRAEIFNHARVDVGVAIHADGGPPDGRGFTVLEPVADGINNRAIKPSRRFDRTLAKTYLRLTGMPYSTYDGIDGLQPRDDLAGENLTKRPYALIECGNMRNATDAARLVRPYFQKRAAHAIAVAITEFLTGHR